MEKKLQRDENRKMLAGVAAGLAEYFDIDVTWVRVIFILMAVFGASGVLVYIILWIVVPPKPYFPDMYKFQADYKVPEGEGGSVPPGRPFARPPHQGKNQGRFIAGLILVGLGVYFLMDRFYFLPYWFTFSKLWPVILIAIGIVILGKSGRSDSFPGYEEKVPPKDDTFTKEENSDKPGDQPLA